MGKPFLTIRQQVELLEKRGIETDSETQVAAVLEPLGFAELSNQLARRWGVG